MSIQQTRRTNPYPWTWEIPAVVGLATLIVLGIGIHVGRTIANGVTGHGWGFTRRDELVTSLPPLLRGDSTAGVDLTTGADERALWVSIGAVELGTIVLLVCAALIVWRRWGPTRVRGMANAAEAETLLGVSRLRRHAHIVRPDLHTAKRWSRR